ncbi:eosinophil cationic protein 2 [Mus pahari]|uniref:eosinophil cationic protein 2 n=1 Tax=Mus pahari TaxID=10093 RepID=UPI000A307209|nr:eosinophil cationic protein 2 [Mus pahari]
MGLKLLESRLCLLLLLGLVLMLASCQQPTASQWFATQHITNKANLQCNIEMQAININRPRCKGLNTFLHTSFINAVGVCGNPSGLCSDGISRNCHNSTSQVPITICNLTTQGRHYTQCRYQTTGLTKYYTVACNPRLAWDCPINPVVPVHLDGTF